MKTKNSRTKSFNSKLAAYSATATAALLVAPAADATIQNITEFSYDGGSTFTTTPPSVSLAGLGRVDFNAGPFGGTLKVSRALGESDSNSFVHANLDGSVACYISINRVSRIPLSGAFAGRNFGHGSALANQSFTTAHHGPGTVNTNTGNFLPPANGAVTGYVGFKTVRNFQTYYGWLRIKVTGDANGAIDTVSLVAKDGAPTIFGAFDLASDASADNFLVGSVAEPVPEPSVAAIGGLSLLALGAMGVREMRRRRKA